MDAIYERLNLVYDVEALNALAASHFFLAGVGGVGGMVAEALVRGGVRRLTLVDADVVAPSNLNRQIVALNSTLGRPKVEVMKDRLLDIAADAEIQTYQVFLTPDNQMHYLTEHKYVAFIDAIDTLNSKVQLLYASYHLPGRIYSAMGAGRRRDPEQLKVVDLMQTQGCPLARQVRSRLKRQGVGKGICAVYSGEAPLPPGAAEATVEGRARVVNGTTSFLPGLVGLMLAGVVLNDFLLDAQIK